MSTIPTAVRKVLPATIAHARNSLAALERDISSAKTYEAIRKIETAAKAWKFFFGEIEGIGQRAERVVVLANHRIGEEVARKPKAKGSRGQLKGRDASGGAIKVPPEDTPTLKEQVGSKKRGVKLRKLGVLSKAEVEDAIKTLHDEGKEATVTAVLKFVGSDDKSEKRAERERALADKVLALPDKRYGVVVADPEWRFEPWSRKTGMDRAADNHYPTSCTEVIAARDVPSISAEDCVLFLWATIPMLPHALAVMEAWDFEYKSHYAWGKDKLGTGYWSREQHELLLIGTRGKVPCPAHGTQSPSLIMAPRGKHSEKPECFLAMIERYFPNVPKIELNRRGAAREGWDAWGDESIAAE